ISDLLDVSRLGAGRLAIERVYVDVATLLQRVVEQFARDGEQTIELKLEEDLSAVHADPERLEQVLANLISNALKYREPDTPILVDARQQAGEIEIAVTNAGAGISAEEVPALFTRFYRAGSASASIVPGLGL